MCSLLLRKVFLASLAFLPIAVFSQPVIHSFIPVSARVGDVVTVNGIGFNSTPASNTVFFGPVKAIVLTATTSQLTVKVPIGAAHHPISVATGGLVGYSGQYFVPGFNNDGHVDFVANSFTNAGVLITSASYWRFDFTAGDFDNDGKIDIVIISDSIACYRNIGTSGAPLFAPKKLFTAVDEPLVVSTGDFNGDGLLDLITINNGYNTMCFYKNTSTIGNISFAAAVTVEMPTFQNDFTLADFDGDGKLDVALSIYYRYGYHFAVFKNTSTTSQISFAEPIDFPVISTPSSIAASDFNNDGKQDIVVGDNGNSATIFMNISTGNELLFERKGWFGVAGRPKKLHVADLNGDGKNDFVAACEGYNYAASLNESSGEDVLFTSITPNRTPIDYTNMSLGDLNGDGKVDVAISGKDPNTFLHEASVMANISTQNVILFGASNRYQSTTSHKNLIADLDGDGIQDIALLSEEGVVSLLLNKFIGPNITSFKPTIALAGDTIIVRGAHFNNASTVSFGGVAAASFSVLNDSTIRAVLGVGVSGAVSVITPNGIAALSGFMYRRPSPIITSFFPALGPIGTQVTISGHHFEPSATDNIVFFGAVKAVVTAASKHELKVTVPLGATYEPITVTSAGFTAFSAKPFTVTFSGDSVFNSSSLSSPTSYALGETTTYKTVASDLDGDGKVDLIADNLLTDINSSGFSVLRNTTGQTGKISFANKLDFKSGTKVSAIAVQDVNGDGKPDVLVAAFDSAASVFLNNSTVGNISFKPMVSFGASGNDIDIKDLDGDGKPDVVITSKTEGFFIYKNIGIAPNIAYELSSSMSITRFSLTDPLQTIILDLDEDGKQDLAAMTGNSMSVSFFKNVSTNDKILFDIIYGTYAQMNKPGDIAFGDIDGDDKADLAAANTVPQYLDIFQNATTDQGISFKPPSVGYFTDIYAEGYSGTGQCAIGDINGDGKADITMVGGNKYLSLFRNISDVGNVLLAPVANYKVGTDVGNICLADFDGDGRLDFAVRKIAPSSGTVLDVLRNQPFAIRIISFSPATGSIGTTVTIKGTRFSEATAVAFGGSQAYSFTIVSDSVITAVIGAGTTGNVSVSSISFTTVMEGFTFVPAKSFVYSPGIEWQKAIGGLNYEAANGIVETKDHGFLVAGYTRPEPGSETDYSQLKMLVAKLNSKGGMVWEKYYSADVGSAGAFSIVEGKDGDFLVAGSGVIQAGAGGRAVLLKINENGETLWQRYYPSTNSSNYVFKTIEPTADGGYIMVGNCAAGFSFSDSARIDKLDASGNLQWQKYYGWGTESANSITQTNDGGYMFTGETWHLTIGSFARPDCWLVKLNAKGNLEWEKRLGGTDDEKGNCIRQTNDGGYIIAGQTNSKDGDLQGNNIYGAWVIKLSNASTIEWQKVVGTNDLTDVRQTIDGGYVFSGAGGHGDDNVETWVDEWVVKLDKTGKMEWEKFMGGSEIEKATSVKQTADTGYIISGYTNSNNLDVSGNHGNNDMWVVKLGENAVVQLCPPLASANIESTKTGAVYQWQVNNGSGFINITTTDTLYSGSNSSSLLLKAIHSSWNGYQYKCVVDGVNAKAFVLSFKNEWVGAPGADWNNAQNWSCGAVPDANTDVTINSGNVIISSNTFCRSLTVRPDATITVKPGYKLTVTH